MQAAILAIGDELVLGQTVDSNSAYLSAELARLGVMTRHHHTVADDRADVAAAFRWAAGEAELIIATGGLGPTDDDLTRDGLADAMGVELVCDVASVRHIQAFFRLRGRPMPDRNRVQAWHPAGSSMIPNPNGTAPGIAATIGRARVFVMPGVPSEMFAMWADAVRPQVEADLAASPSAGSTILTAKVNTFGKGESDVAQLLGDLMKRDRNPLVGTTVSEGIVSVRIRSQFSDAAAAHRELADTIAQVEAHLGPIVFGRDDDTLADKVVALLKEHGRTIATAESCTGGLVGKMLTDVAGSSAVYQGGWVTYSNAMKSSQLGVPPELIAEHGTVSEPVARAMATGAVAHSGADLGVGVTGIAGPDGGSPDKPVGTVWVALAHRDRANPPDTPAATDALLFILPGDRRAVRDRSAKCALQMVRFHLLGVPLSEIRWARRTRTG
jgi:competence/damage-inducible protein CinA-like protein